MDFGAKQFDEIGEVAQRIRAIASAAYFNPCGSAGAKKAIDDKANEIKELLKALPE